MAKLKTRDVYTVYGNEARQLYMIGRTPKMISLLLPVTKRTIERWIERYDWNEQRKKRRVILSEVSDFSLFVLREKLDELQRMPPSDVTAGMIDAVHKLYKQVEALNVRHMRLEHTIAVFDDFSEWLARKVGPETLDKVFSYAQGYVKHLAEKQELEAP